MSLAEAEKAAPSIEERRAEILAEVHWLLDGGVHPIVIAKQLNYSPLSIARWGHDADDHRITYEFRPTNVRPRL